MTALLNLYAQEPAVILSGAGAVVTALIVLLVSFGIQITMEQKAAINALVVVVINVGAGVVIRSRVTPVSVIPPVIQTPVIPPPAG